MNGNSVYGKQHSVFGVEHLQLKTENCKLKTICKTTAPSAKAAPCTCAMQEHRGTRCAHTQQPHPPCACAGADGCAVCNSQPCEKNGLAPKPFFTKRMTAIRFSKQRALNQGRTEINY